MNETIEYRHAEIRPMLAFARVAQADWCRQSFADRRRYFRRLRRLIASNAMLLAQTAAEIKNRPLSEKLASEVVPLADTCCWLEKRTGEVLRPRLEKRKHRPLWLQGVAFDVHRHPFGIILVIGPANYPLFIPGSQILHALAAGNAVLFKPAPGTEMMAEVFARIAGCAGLDAGLFQVLPAMTDSAIAVIREGIDKIIFTGRSKSGRSILAEAAARNTPAVMELTGEDAALVLADADLDLVIRCLRFSARWNGGETCIAPQRLIVVEAIASEFRRKLAKAAELPELPIQVVPDTLSAVREAMATPFGLGVSVFSANIGKAKSVAASIKSGFALINDLIVPIGDPRMPFGGVKASGFGVTRGAEGLLEMTYPHVVAARHGRFRPHLDELHGNATNLFASYLLAAHGQGRQRCKGFQGLLAALITESRTRRAKK